MWDGGYGGEVLYRKDRHRWKGDTEASGKGKVDNDNGACGKSGCAWESEAQAVGGRSTRHPQAVEKVENSGPS